MNDPIGYRFSPTEEESVNYYLKNKNLGKSWLVDDVISEINICSCEPKDLPALSKIKSYDLEWYFFALKVYANLMKKTMKRTAVNGFWKVTGPDKKIKDKRGRKIGFKKTLVYHEGKGDNGVRTPWVIHEYHITNLPRKQPTYVLCHLKYKGDHRDISYGGNDSVVSHSDIGREINTVPEAVQVEQPVEDCLNLNDLSYPLNVQEDLRPRDAIDSDVFVNPNLLQETLDVQVEAPVLEGLSLDDLEMPENEQDDLPPPDDFDPDTFFNLSPQTPYADNYGNDFFPNDIWNLDDVIPDQVIVQENRNVYMPKKALSGIIVDSSSDSAELISVHYS